jgi:hypothetical protein
MSYGGGLALSTADWRRFAQQPGGILTILALVLLLAFRLQVCPMLTDLDPAPPDTHGCCHDTAATPDTPPAPAFSTCHDGPCLQAFGDHGGFDLYGPSANGSDGLALTVTSELLPPDWSGKDPLSPPFITAIGPPPSQRSLILRL